MKIFVTILQIILAISLIGLILLQNSKGGLGSAFGAGEFYSSRRGAEKVVFLATIGVAVFFLLSSIVNLLSP